MAPPSIHTSRRAEETNRFELFLRFKVSLFVAGSYILGFFFNLAYTEVFKIKKS